MRTKSEVLSADAVVVSVDARTAIDKLFREPLQDRWARKMRAGLKTTQCMFLGVGVKADLSPLPRSMQIVLPRPLKAADRTYDTVVVNNYATDDGYALLWSLRRKLYDRLATVQSLVSRTNTLS